MLLVGKKNQLTTQLTYICCRLLASKCGEGGMFLWTWKRLLIKITNECEEVKTYQVSRDGTTHHMTSVREDADRLGAKIFEEVLLLIRAELTW